MRGLNFKLIFNFFVFALSIGAAWATESGSKAQWWRASLGHHMVTSSNQRRPAHKKRKFKLVDHRCESGCTDTYESSEGRQVSLDLACWTSSGREALHEMQRMISEGTVVKRGRRYYGHGKERRLGARAVAIYPRDETGEKPAKIFWYVDGICFNFIEAGSLKLALEFERSDEFDKVSGW